MLSLKKPGKFLPVSDVVGCLFWAEGKILLLKRATEKSYPGRWGLPGGKINEGESRLDAIIREVKEETGINLSSGRFQTHQTYYVVNPKESFVYTMYISRFEKIPGVNINRIEHVNYAWYRPEEALKLKLMPDADGCIEDAIPKLMS